MELELRYYGDPILREKCAPVDRFDQQLAEEAEAMVETMFRERGIGLAAPQVGMTKRLIVAVQMKDTEDVDAEPLALVNPRVLERSRSTWEYEEGCLSIPGVVGKVVRSEEAVVRYQDVEGNEHTIKAEGMFARVLLHEIDHLDGRLFVDYLSSAQKSLIKPELKRIAAELAPRG
ncbi:MAG: peptide deformylase [Candidatus Latescibacterota bacterium]|jgi:peptide deformylase